MRLRGCLFLNQNLRFVDTSKYELKDTVWRFALGDPANTGGG